MKSFRTCASVLGLSITSILAMASARAQSQPEAMNVELVAQLDLNGNGDGGEGMAIQKLKDGRRILYFAHEGQKTCLSVVDVTYPKAPSLLVKLPSPGPWVTRCNSLGLSRTILA